MPAVEDAMEAHLIACVHESLAAFLYDNASFLCERLVALSSTPVRFCSKSKHCLLCQLACCPNFLIVIIIIKFIRGRV